MLGQLSSAGAGLCVPPSGGLGDTGGGAEAGPDFPLRLLLLTSTKSEITVSPLTEQKPEPEGDDPDR